MPPARLLRLAVIAVALTCTGSIFFWTSNWYSATTRNKQFSDTNPSKHDDFLDRYQWMPKKQHRRVLVGSSFAAHEGMYAYKPVATTCLSLIPLILQDVYMSFVHTLSHLIPPQNIRVYPDGFRWNFTEVIAAIRPAFFQEGYHRPEQLLTDLERTDLFTTTEEDVGLKPDLVVLGTCEFE